MAFDPNDLKFRNALKAYVALFGALVTAVLGVTTTGSTLGQILTVCAALGTAVGTWLATNPPTVVIEQPEVGQAVIGLQDDHEVPPAE